MTVDDLAQTLADLSELDGTTVFLDEFSGKVRAAFLAGNGVVGAITAGSANGKSVSLAVDLSPGDTLRAVVLAKKKLNGSAAPAIWTLDHSSVLN